VGGEAYSYCKHRGVKIGTETIASKCKGRGVNENIKCGHGETGCEEVARTYLTQNGKNAKIIRYPWN